ncbi:hypothetical protein HGRIS_009697 [Hohenbuehelia grisea]|uniref:Uncharacterized protein n=1 Tax=Hohenbuehelia grisea TaxID=104357 RepID=A0ABR3J1Y1_9AGAR
MSTAIATDKPITSPANGTDRLGGNHAYQGNTGYGSNDHNYPSGNYTARPSRIANPGPLGLFSFATTLLVLGLYNVRARGVTHVNGSVGMALFYGGLAMVLAGMWEFPRGNSFAATLFTTYGAFWLSYATIFIPSSGITSGFTDDRELNSALGIFMLAWMVVTIFLLLGSLRKNIGFIVFLTTLTITYALWAATQFRAVETTSRFVIPGFLLSCTKIYIYFLP